MIDNILMDEYHEHLSAQGLSGRHHYTTSQSGGVFGNPGYKTALPDADNSCYQCSHNHIDEIGNPRASLHHSQHAHRSPSAPRGGFIPSYLTGQHPQSGLGASFRGHPTRVGFQQTGALQQGSLTGGAHGRSMNTGLQSVIGNHKALQPRTIERSSSAHQRGLVGHTDTALTTAADGNLKSSMKYSKPLILQNASIVAGTANQSRMYQSGLNGTMNANNKTTIGGDHDDLKLKLDKLMAKFAEESKDKNAFKDTFFDTEILAEIVASKNYFKLSLDLMKYVLHSGNVPKPKVEKKKTDTLGGLYSLYKK